MDDSIGGLVDGDMAFIPAAADSVTPSGIADSGKVGEHINMLFDKLVTFICTF